MYLLYIKLNEHLHTVCTCECKMHLHFYICNINTHPSLLPLKYIHIARVTCTCFIHEHVHVYTHKNAMYTLNSHLFLVQGWSPQDSRQCWSFVCVSRCSLHSSPVSWRRQEWEGYSVWCLGRIHTTLSMLWTSSRRLDTIFWYVNMYRNMYYNKCLTTCTCTCKIEMFHIYTCLHLYNG